MADPIISSEVQKWENHIKTYEREFKKWETRVEKIVKRYRDDSRSKDSSARFNVLWSNVQTLTAATFSKLPKPDVSRRFRDNDPVGRVAALILERALDFEVQHYPDYREAMTAAVKDRFLGGRGTAWVRYEPHFKQAEGITDTVEAESELDYECAPVDYVHWKDFGHVVARTWSEVPATWRKVYLTRKGCVERFGSEKGKKIPLDATPEDLKRQKYDGGDTELSRACVYEIADKENKEAIWLSRSLKEILDKKPDPWGLAEFFPCPKPIYATLTNDSLVPVPDFTLYQDQANELDTLCDRIDGLVKALKVVGGYDASIPELARIFSEGTNNDLLPIKNWAAFAEKNGLQGSLSLVDLKPFAAALAEAYTAFEQIKQQIYEITRISDIMRGYVNPEEKLGQSQLKSQYGNLGIKAYQDEIARFATDLLQLKAQIICNKFAPQTIVAISASDQLSQNDQQMLEQAMALLVGQERMQSPEAEDGPNPLRSFRVEVAADSLIYIDEDAEKQARVEFLTATGGFIEKMGAVLMQTPPEAKGSIVGLLMEMLKFGVTGFRVGKTIEGAFDETSEKLKQLAAQPPQPQVPPEVQVEQMRGQVKQQSDQAQNQREVMKIQGDQQLERERMAGEIQLKREQHAAELDSQERMAANDQSMQIKQLLSDHQHRVGGMMREAEMRQTHQGQMQQAQGEAQQAQAETKEASNNAVAKALEQVAQANAQMNQHVAELLKAVSAPKRIVRGEDGKASHLETVQ